MRTESISLKSFTLGVLITATVSAGLVFAAQQEEELQRKWEAVWHGTEWIGSGETIRAKEVAENFEYLYKEIEKPITISRLPSGTVVAGCLTSRKRKATRNCTFAGYNCSGGGDNAVGTVCTPKYNCSTSYIYVYVADICWGGANVPQGATKLMLSCPTGTAPIVTSDKRIGFCVVE